jgi:signal transduction histidine kinase
VSPMSQTFTCTTCAKNSDRPTLSKRYGASVLSSAHDAKPFGALHWRLTFFYTAAMAILFCLLGWYLDRQLWYFATLQMEDRVMARAASLPGLAASPPKLATAAALPPPEAPVAPIAPAASLAPIAGGSTAIRSLIPIRLNAPFRSSASPLQVTVSLTALADGAARTDVGSVTTTLLSTNGEPIYPEDPPLRWQAEPNLAPDLFTVALRSGRPIGPLVVRGPATTYVILDQPLASRSRVEAVAQLSTPTSELDGLLQSFRLALGLGLVVLIAAAFVLGRPLAELALRPLARLTMAVAHVSPDRLAERVPVPAPDDQLRALAIAFNQMLTRIDSNVQLQAKGQQQLRRFVGDASHELRSPLTALSGYVDLLLQPQGPAEMAHVAPRMRRELDRMSHLVQDLLVLTRLDAAPNAPASVKPIEFAEVTAEVVESMMLEAAPRRLELAAPDGELWVNGDRDGIERVLQNLLSNAIQHTDECSVIQTRLAKNNGYAELRVIDDGEGIPPEHLGRIFDRFYRVDPARSRADGNAGLGLAIVKAIVQQHQGTIDVTSSPGQGSTFTVRLPMVNPAPI